MDYIIQTRRRLMAITLCFALSFSFLLFGVSYAALDKNYAGIVQLIAALELKTSSLVIRIAITSLIMGLAYLLFRLREKKLHVYAILEIGFSAASIWYASDPTKDIDSFQRMLACIASGYIFVRGCSNLKEAKKLISSH